MEQVMKNKVGGEKLHTRKGFKVSTVVIVAVLLIYALAVLIPFYMVTVTSFVGEAELQSTSGFIWWPKMGFTIEAYRIMFSEDIYVQNGLLSMPSLFVGFFNTLWTTLLVSVCSLFFSGLAAYSYSKVNFVGKKKFFMVDRHGVIRSDRPQYNNGEKPNFINDSGPKTLAEACDNADVLLGVSGPGLITDDELMHLAPKAVVFACSNPDPEVDPETVRRLRPDIIIGTGRSDYPNQINNVLCFPFLFRGTLDVRATCINLEMKKAAMNALRELAQEPVPEEVVKAAQVDHLEFGPDYVIPKPQDPRLLKRLSRAVAKAAVDSGVAQIPLPEHYMED